MKRIAGDNPIIQEEATDAAALRDTALQKRREMSWHDYLIALLHMGSALEHSLMVQYLYAAYSLGGEQVPPEHRPMVQQWQETILAVAREEMGHLLTVQNVLTFLGAGLSLTRERLPWNIEWFNLEPFTIDALACYVYAEMPEDENFPERKLIEELALKHVGGSGKKIKLQLRPVGEVYSDIMAVLGNADYIPDSAFQDQSYVLQASWDDWGRGYKPDPLPLDPEGNLDPISAQAHRTAQFRAHVMIDRVATRTQALAALKALSIQGEGPLGPEKETEWSHFKRFIKIFREYQSIQNEQWCPTLPVPINPNTVDDSNAPDRQGYISSIQSRNWADLFNLRYRMLLTFLLHTFQVARDCRPGEPNIRAMLMHKVFGEMYQLKAIAGILVQRPLRDGTDPNTPPHEVPRAGPPFELPFNLRLPVADADCWCLHLDILGKVSEACQAIRKSAPSPGDHAYLDTLMDLDRQTKVWIERILAGMNSTERYSS
jgi:hypothetical protein